MNTRYYMVIIKGEIKTSEIMSCGYNRNNQKWDVKFNNGKTYSYAYLNVEKLTDPEVLNPNMYRISREGREFFDVNAIYVFRSRYESYWHICFGNGSERDYHRSELNIVESCLTQSQSSNVFEYIKQIAGLSNIRNEETGEKLLSKRFDKISFVGSDVALARYLNPSSLQGKRTGREYNPIFPFGCNNSQYKAVKSAMENQISVIQGPPGTGKTQTILNIIANILMQGKTVQIVSNNNSATENVYEKLSSPKYNLGFIAATLGSSKNKKLFVEHQDAAYPDFSSWKTQEDPSVLQKGIAEQSSQLKSVFDKQEKLACLRQELSQLVTEQEYFNQYVKESDVHTDSINFKKKLSSKQWMVLWQECQLISDEKTAIGFWFKIKALFKYGVTDWSIYKQDISKIITTFQAMYYCAKQAELSAKIADIEKYLNSVNKNLLEDLCKQSMIVLKDKLARKYEGNSSRKTFSEDNLWKEPYDVLVEYPVILSTTLYRVENLDRYDDRLQVTTNLIEAYDLLMEFVAKHTSDKFCLINNISTSIRGIISREVIGNILVHRDYSSAYPAKVIIEKDWMRTENWCIPRRHGNIMSDEFTPYPKNPLIQQFFANIGRTDTIGSGVRNLYKYTPMYSDGGKPELIEDDVFRINIPLDRIAADEATEQKTLSEREQKIYNMICENLHLSVEQVMAELDISRSTVFRDYAKIKKVTGAAYDKKTSTWTL